MAQVFALARSTYNLSVSTYIFSFQPGNTVTSIHKVVLCCEKPGRSDEFRGPVFYTIFHFTMNFLNEKLGPYPLAKGFALVSCGLALSAVVKIRNQLAANEVKYSVAYKGVVLITGASTGIGQHAALYLAERYPNVIVLAGVRKESDAQVVVSYNKANLLPIIIDVAKPESCQAAVVQIGELCNDRNLSFIGLINNAGVARRYPAEFHDMADAKRIFDTNFWGAYYLTQLTLPMLRSSKGRIVNISSISEFMGNPMNSVYVASKYAMGGFSDSLRREIAHFGISVSVVQPAYVKSAIFDTAKSAAVNLEQIDKQASTARASPAADSTCDNAVQSQTQTHYGHFFSATELARLDEEVRRDASEPIVVSEAIEHALFAAYPKTRYAVGRVAGFSAEMCAWIRWALNDRAVDKLITPVPTTGI